MKGPTNEQCGSLPLAYKTGARRPFAVPNLPHAPPPEEVWPRVYKHIYHRREESRHSLRPFYQAQVYTTRNDAEDDTPQVGQEPPGEGARHGRRVLAVRRAREGEFPAVLVSSTWFTPPSHLPPLLRRAIVSSLLLIPALYPLAKSWLRSRSFQRECNFWGKWRSRKPGSGVLWLPPHLRSAVDLRADWPMFSMTCEKQFVPQDEKFLYCSES